MNVAYQLCKEITITAKKSKFLPSPFLVKRVAPVSVSLAFGLHGYTSARNDTVGGWPSGSTVFLTPMLSREIACTIFQVIGMTRPDIEPRSTGQEASILPPGNGCRIITAPCQKKVLSPHMLKIRGILCQ